MCIIVFPSLEHTIILHLNKIVFALEIKNLLGKCSSWNKDWSLVNILDEKATADHYVPNPMAQIDIWPFTV